MIGFNPPEGVRWTIVKGMTKMTKKMFQSPRGGKVNQIIKNR